MVTVYQIQKGFARFVDNHIAGAFDGWQKIVVLSGATLVANNMSNIIKNYESHPLVSSLGIINKEAGLVNVDDIYNALIPHLQNEKLAISIPSVGIVKLGSEEITILYNYIKEEQ